MSTLFTVSSSWHSATWLYEQLAFAVEGDAILLLEDGVLGLQSPITLASFLGKCNMQGIAVYGLLEDCMLRGIDNQYSAIRLVDYSGFVDLVCQHSKQVAW